MHTPPHQARRVGAPLRAIRGALKDRTGNTAHSIALVALAGILGGCQAGSNPQPAKTSTILAPGVSVNSADLPGSWGLASYRMEADRRRTETEARSACSNPYRIEPGANGGVMMHLADQSTPSEVFLKTDAQGRTFIGPPGPAGVAQDRMIASFESGVLITEWLDQSARERYGTMLFVRCT